MLTLYGIKNCDTVRKARKWLDQHGVDYQFHDFREDGLDSDRLQQWLDELGWETVINRRSTSWKALSPEVRETMDQQVALREALAAPTLIKRPVLDTGEARHLGFSAANYQKILNLHTL